MLASGKYETSNPAETKKREGIGKNACIGPMTQKRGASAPLFFMIEVFRQTITRSPERGAAYVLSALRFRFIPAQRVCAYPCD